MKERLDELIRIIKERQVVEKIVAAADSEKKLSVFVSEKAELSEEIESFKKDAEENLENSGFVIVETYDISEDDALPFCIVCMMTNIEDNDMIVNGFDLANALELVEGDENLSKIAHQLAEFLRYDCFGMYEVEEILESFFK